MDLFYSRFSVWNTQLNFNAPYMRYTWFEVGHSKKRTLSVNTIKNLTMPSNQAALLCHHSVCPNGFRQIFNYLSGLWMLLSHIILSQTCSKLRNDSIEDSTGENLLEENREGFHPSHQIQVGRIDITQTRLDCQDTFKMADSEITSVETNCIRITGNN